MKKIKNSYFLPRKFYFIENLLLNKSGFLIGNYLLHKKSKFEYLSLKLFVNPV